ncbi:Chromatin modification-related protein EAF1 B [Glycine soja]|uniref:Chromatin modification-related protein EAF1 B n=2 Tax=Glycine soja TaxID=3848 RepID=A0A445FTQ0_GLYSO|nr:Chromatin modification-related protein EAF1 B [Glycine soja]
MPGYHLVGSCNGLHCGVSEIPEGYRVCFWNKATRVISRESPTLSFSPGIGRRIMFGFGYDPSSDKYKVVAIALTMLSLDVSEKTEMKVFGAGDNSWRNLKGFPVLWTLPEVGGVYLSGTINWVVIKGKETIHSEIRDHAKKRLDSHHFEPNGSSGLYGQHSVKKLKPTKQSLDNFDNVAPIANSIPSPAASQMSNMSSPSKFIRIISGGRDRGRKAKALKVSVGEPGSGSPWSLFEDQALVVLVHDMGPNWELVSDAINSTREGFRSYDLTRMT